MKKMIFTAALGTCLVLGACSNNRNNDESTESPAYDERETDGMNDDMNNTDDMNRDNTNTDDMDNTDTAGYNNNTPTP